MYTYFGFTGDPTDNFITAGSDDGVNWTTQGGSWPGQIDAPKGFLYDGSVYFHVGTANDRNFQLVPWLIGKSDTNGIVSTITTIDWTSSGFKICDSGGWFQEASGEIHLFVPCSTGAVGSENYAIFESHALTSGGSICTSTCDLLHWSAPVAISVSDTNIYDPQPLLIGTTYYMWLTNHTVRNVELASASTLLGPYTVALSPGFAGWSITNFLEGPNMYSAGATSWKLAVEHYDSSKSDNHQMYYSRCNTLDPTACTWTALTPWTEDFLYRNGNIVKNF